MTNAHQHDGHGEGHSHQENHRDKDHIHNHAHEDENHDHGHMHRHHGGGFGHHHHTPSNFGRAFGIGISLNVLYVFAQVVFGLQAHSLALLADAGHNLGDVLGLLLAWYASVLARRLPTARHTYGLRRTSILASLGNAILLLIAVGGITWEAIRRFWEPAPVAGMTVIWVAALGIVLNGFTAFLFAGGRKDDLNIKGAFLHMASDAAVSAGVVVAGIAILFTGWRWLDPAVSLLINAVIVLGTWGLLKESVNLALDAVPAGIDLDSVRQYLESLAGIHSVHDLHVWALSTTDTALTAHLVRADKQADEELLIGVCRELRSRFGVGHATIQLECAETAQRCELAPDNVI
jgi:cobalt-zinc-cadmium efflux system protein